MLFKKTESQREILVFLPLYFKKIAHERETFYNTRRSWHERGLIRDSVIFRNTAIRREFAVEYSDRDESRSLAQSTTDSHAMQNSYTHKRESLQRARICSRCNRFKAIRNNAFD